MNILEFEPTDPDFLVARLPAYYDMFPHKFGEVVIQELKPILEGLKQDLVANPPAAVFDIDETLILTNTDDDGFTVHPAVHKVYRFLRQEKVPIFVVTARRKSEASAQYAINQLSNFYTELEDLYMVNAQHDDDESASVFKFKSRKRVIQKGYTIVLNAGDNWSDLGLMVKYGSNKVHREWKGTYPDKTKHYLLHDAEATSRLSWKVPNKHYEVA